MKKVVDLFAGCGGMTQGFENVGFEIVGAFENWRVAAKCYSQNFDHPVYLTDLADVEIATLEVKSLKPDVIIGGPPCQDFSHAGKRIESSRADLTKSFAEIVRNTNPDWFVMENVDRVKSSAAYSNARSIFKNSGYGLTEIVIDASHCGVPQKRKRFFAIGSKNDNDGFLEKRIHANLTEHETTLRDFFGSSLGVEHYYRHPRNYNRRAVFSIDEPAPTIRGVNRPVPAGYPGHPNDSTVLTDSIRAMTTEERARVQTFPSNFNWVGTKTEVEQLIGNAVPVKLAEFVANNLLDHIYEYESAGVPQLDFEDFFEWLTNLESFTKRVQVDTISRLRRADSICKIRETPDDYYQYCLETSPEFRNLTGSVKSQLKRAVNLYSNFCREKSAQYL